MKRIGILTGGGDAPALNAVIRAVTRSANNDGTEVLGFQEGWRGIIEGITMPIDWKTTDDKISEGGTILGSSRTNPFRRNNGVEMLKENFKKFQLDALVVIGGDDTLGVANRLFHEHDVPTVGCPKTIDNDLSATDFTFGYDTAVNIAMESIDKLITTARSHRRVIVVEIMGRHAGWIAAGAGIAGGADVTLVPENPFSLDRICKTLRRNRERGKLYNIVAVAEGAKLGGGEDFHTQDDGVDEFGHIRLGGIAKALAREIEDRTGYESRHVVLGHLQRGGHPSAFDRVLGTRVGIKAYETLKAGEFGKMIALKGADVVAVPLKEGVGKLKLLSEDYMKVLDTFEQ